MKNFLKCIILFPILLLLTACATEPQRLALSSQNQKNIYSTKAIVNTAQNGIKLEANDWFNSTKPDPYDPMDTGYIVRSHSGAAGEGPDILTMITTEEIGKHIINKSNIAIAPVRQDLKSFSYMNYFKNDLNKKLLTLSWLKLKNLQVEYDIKQMPTIIVNTAKEHNVLFVGTTYYLNSTFKSLEVAAYVRLDAKSKNSPTILYKNNFYYIYRLSSNNKKINFPIWTKNNAALLKAKLRQASVLLSDAIVSDISNKNIISNTAPVVSVLSINGFKDNAKIISKTNSHYVISLVNGSAIYIVNRLN